MLNDGKGHEKIGKEGSENVVCEGTETGWEGIGKCEVRE